MRFTATMADTWVTGWTFSAPALHDDDHDTLLISNANPTPAKIGFHNASGLTISYNGSPVQALELVPDALFIGSVKHGNIVPLHGELKPIPAFPFTETPFHKISWSIPITTTIGNDFNPDAYDRAQRKEREKLRVAFKEVRAAKKLSREQEEDL